MCVCVPGYPIAACQVVLYGYFLHALCILPLPLLHCRTFLATSPHTHPALALSLPSIHQHISRPLPLHGGPSTALTFLAILVNMSKFELHLSGDQLTYLQHAIQQWVHKHAYTQRDLESFLGHLSHAATVIFQGRVFSPSTVPTSITWPSSHHHIRLYLGARADSLWWQAFFQDWNGTPFFSVTSISSEVFSDAAGTFGCRAFTSTH